ncbi:D-alanyl-D-alanine carboxypeptidase [Paracoccus sp. (in: a-proteobacteria)]|uniref:D-alanyl-D-alanine carboxypeptidase n=1 Tax=Paracoccus sp. TaxID=267 RepID=UPI0026E09D62|nr:D-alanyl-D-alanine carboxypeptidase [Paracoccus sp. (in: a-proteobacteria)]MDO5646372.1 D-alanyl-D-alanine carboxypeptidase [Paracoccus sp. (in: a-proteobacteria)]
MISRRLFLGGVIAAPVTAWADPLAMRPPLRPVPSPDQVLARAGLRGIVSYAVLPLRGDALLRDADTPLPPASTLKALTAMYVLDRLGAAHRFRTRVFLAGDALILAGGGDPVLSTDDLAVLAADIAPRLRDTPPRRFLVWGGALPQLTQIAPEQAAHLPYNPSISGMMLNFNRVHLGWRARGTDLTVEARAARHTPRAFTINAAAADHGDLFRYRADEAREYWTVSRAAMAQPGSRWLPVRLPAVYAGDVFQTLCRAQGLALPAPEITRDPPQGVEIAYHTSPETGILLRDMLEFSTNITAEALGLYASGAADLGASAAAMQAWLGPVASGLHLADHSGLSEASRVTARDMAAVMQGPGRELGIAALLRQTRLPDDGPLAAQVASKSGTLNFVSNLAGYVTAPDGGSAAFALICADPARRAAAIGQENPAGVVSWTRQARALHRDLLTSFAAKL